MTLSASFALRRHYFLIAAIVLVADQITKYLAHVNLAPRGVVVIVDGFFDLAYSRNRGGLFGAMSDLGDPWRMLLLTVVPLLAIGMISWFLLRTDEVDRPTLFGLGLILGGAVGNLVDRVARGEVIDFLDVYVSSPRPAEWLVAHFGTAHWPTFNVADSAIVCGAGLLVLSLFRPQPQPQPVEPAGPGAE